MIAPTDPPELDAKALAVLHALDPDGRYGTVAKLLGTYEQTLPRQLAAVAIERDDAERVEFLAHSMKSASRAVGATAFADVCDAVEQRLKGGDRTQLDADAERLLAGGEQALAAVRARLRCEPMRHRPT